MFKYFILESWVIIDPPVRSALEQKGTPFAATLLLKLSHMIERLGYRVFTQAWSRLPVWKLAYLILYQVL